MLVIGLTGGIGSGKSTVAELFAARGVSIIDTDQLSRDLTQPGQTAFNAIVEKFGPDVLLANGHLDRKALRTLIFADADKRAWLEALLHPSIREAMRQQAESATTPYCIAVIPLLLETKPNPLINRILVVDAPEAHQIQRTATRDLHLPHEVEAIMNTQVNRQTRLAAADDVIYNDGKLDDLAPQVDKLHQFYLSLNTNKPIS
jgi:dephospho-CoA kinase